MRLIKQGKTQTNNICLSHIAFWFDFSSFPFFSAFITRMLNTFHSVNSNLQSRVSVVFFFRYNDRCKHNRDRDNSLHNSNHNSYDPCFIFITWTAQDHISTPRNNRTRRLVLSHGRTLITFDGHTKQYRERDHHYVYSLGKYEANFVYYQAPSIWFGIIGLYPTKIRR